jgi:hypothetical protein
MNRFVGLLLIALIAVLVLVFILNPQLLDKVWLWVIGFIGYILALIEKGFNSIKNLFRRDPEKPEGKENAPAPGIETGPKRPEPIIDELERILINNPQKGRLLTECDVTVIRYLDDGDTTLGMLFLNNKFFSYTLEDTHNDEKISGDTRIPEGIYPLELNRNLTDLTKRYRKRFPWFEYHIELKEIPNYSLVYIHIGNTHVDTRGCILVADGVNAASTEKMVTHSQRAFERLYKTLNPKLAAGQKMTLQILNEDWFERVQLFQNTEKATA